MTTDGGYDSRVTFALLAALGIIPVIRVRINSGARAKGKNRARPRRYWNSWAEGAAAPAGNQTA